MLSSWNQYRLFLGFHMIRAGIGFRQNLEIGFLVYMINQIKGAVQILVLPQSMTWKINVFAHTVIIQDTQWYNGRAHTYADYAVTDVLRMMGRAGRITLDEEGKCIVLCQSSKKEFFKKVQSTDFYELSKMSRHKENPV